MQPHSDIIATTSADRDQIAEELKTFVAAPDFPCVGAKAALRRDQLEILVASDIRRNAYDRLVTGRLQEFAIRHDVDQTMFFSQAIVYRNDADLTEGQFETFLWQRLSAFHAIDAETYRWDPSVDSDPHSPHFSLSIGGKGFFVVGLHPNAARLARRFK
ncbi:conserved protein of unknown function [Hyphomicrobium sp. 1Nfss2.1]